MAVGIFGGAFDPPHNGHVALARTAMERLDLDRLEVTVVVAPGHKETVASAEHRLELARLAFAGLGTVEPEPHEYTVDALEFHGYEDPVFLIGADELAELRDLEGAGASARAGAARRRHTTRLPSGDDVAADRDLRARAVPGLVLRDPRAGPARRADRRARAGGRRGSDRRARPVSGRLTPRLAATLSALTSIDQARRIAALASEKLAEDVVILDMRPVCVYTDFFVLATGRNARQTKAIFDEVHSQLKQEAKLLPRAVDGAAEADWIIADYLDVVLHVFTPDTRDFYRLEDLWGDVPAVDVEAATA